MYRSTTENVPVNKLKGTSPFGINMLCSNIYDVAIEQLLKTFEQARSTVEHVYGVKSTKMRSWLLLTGSLYL